MGAALTQHRRSLILRRTNKEASRFISRFAEIVGHRNGWNGVLQLFRMEDGREIEFGGCQLESDAEKYRGSPHDLICFDEGVGFTESQYRFIIGWNRSVDKDQRCRVILASNPPTNPEGLWVFKYWGAWLDPAHPNPAAPGELRWYTTIAGKDEEVDGPGPHRIDGQDILARSRTFIPAELSDNPDLDDTNYGSVLAALPPGLREAYYEGRFQAVLKDDDWQVIPTHWILEAQDRWREDGYGGNMMTAVGLDCAGGGQDAAVIAARYGGWFAPLVEMQGDQTADGLAMFTRIMQLRRDNCSVIVDVGGGYAGGVIEHLKSNAIDFLRFDGASRSTGHALGSNLAFKNRRAEALWRFREALDPDQEGGSAVALPPDAELRADLAAPRWEPTPGGIQIESKEHIRKRIGRSPNKGDAVMMALAMGDKAAVRRQGRMGRAPKNIQAYAKAKRMYRRY
jgi:hypothetical protein